MNSEEMESNFDMTLEDVSSDLINISRSPVPCPVSACRQMIGVTSVLTHFMRDHKQAFGGDFQEIEADHRTLLMFCEQFFEREKTLCLGVLAYAGKKSGRSPGQTRMSRPNAFLPEKFSCFTNHLPILILGCKTHLSSLLVDKQLCKSLVFPDSDPNDDLLVIWLATMEITKPIHCTITAFHPDMKTSRSSIVKVRNLKNSQSPKEFIPLDTDCLILNRGELTLLAGGTDSNRIELEIIIHELDH